MLKMITIYATIFFSVMLLAMAFDGGGSLTVKEVMIAGIGSCFVGAIAWLRYDWLSEFHKRRERKKWSRERK